VQTGLSFLQEDAKEPAYGYDSWTYSLGFYRILPHGFSVYLEGSLTQSRYQAPQLDYVNGSAVSKTRKDDITGVALSLSSTRLEKYNLTPTLQYSYTQSRSNIRFWEYERNRLDLLFDLKI
jgi:hypothetical protein